MNLKDSYEKKNIGITKRFGKEKLSKYQKDSEKKNYQLL